MPDEHSVEWPPEFNYLDEATITIKIGPHPSLPPDETWIAVLYSPPLGWSEDETLLRLQREVFRAPDGYSYPYTLDVSKGHHSWGADGAGANILVYLSDQAVGAAVALATEAQSEES